MSPENDMPDFKLEYTGNNGYLRTVNGNIRINDFKLNIMDKIKVSCEVDSIPNDYRHRLSDDEIEKHMDLIKQIPGFQIPTHTIDNYILSRDIIELNLTDDDGLELHLEVLLCWVEFTGDGYSFDIDALKVSYKTGEIENSETVKLYKLLEAEFNNTKMEYDDTFTPTAINDLKYFGGELTDFEKSLGYFFLEDNYENIKRREDELTDNLWYLMSLFLGTFVSLRVSFLVGENGKEVEIGVLNTLSSRRGSTIFFPEMTNQLSTFLNSTYDKYLIYKVSFGLRGVIRHFIRMKEANHTEMMLLMGSVLLESLKYNYAKEYKSYREEWNKFVRPRAAHKASNDLRGRDFYNFRQLLNEIFNEFFVTHNSTNFIDYRNEVIHTGVWNSLSYDDKKRILNEMELSITEVIFNILQFKGQYYNLETHECEEYEPPVI